ncbi:MAG: hypothetical protein U5K74_01465 [Gemmatimonadaceae bacterium]|nr:hypothetical protein [Gemmatimonadaceae bacterium]
MCAKILGADDDVVAVGDHDALTRRLAWWLGGPPSSRNAHGTALRARVAAHYSLSAVATQFIARWSSLARGWRARVR